MGGSLRLDSNRFSDNRYDALEDFWKFIVERQATYWRRYVKRELPPWSRDPILREYFFTNVYRELDKGTKFWIEDIVPHCENYRYLVWNLFVYRYFNAIPTYQFLAEQFGDGRRVGFEWQHKHKQVAQTLTRWETQGNKVFTSAFTVTGVRFGGYPDKISNVCFLLERLLEKTPAVVGRLARCSNLHDVFRVFHSLDGLGPFLAYELTIDINYPHTIVDFSEDDFVNPGPGCKAGITFIYGHKSTQGYVDTIKDLRWHQEEYMEHFGLLSRWMHVYPGYQLSLRSIEHSLCEFSKYARTKYRMTARGTPSSNATRRFDARTRIQAVLG